MATKVVALIMGHTKVDATMNVYVLVGSGAILLFPGVREQIVH